MSVCASVCACVCLLRACTLQVGGCGIAVESGSQVALGARETTVVLVRYGIRAIWDIGYGIAAVRYGIVDAAFVDPYYSYRRRLAREWNVVDYCVRKDTFPRSIAGLIRGD